MIIIKELIIKKHIAIQIQTLIEEVNQESDIMEMNLHLVQKNAINIPIVIILKEEVKGEVDGANYLKAKLIHQMFNVKAII